MNDGVLAQLATLPAQKTPELRQLWVDLYGKPAPAVHRRYLVARLGYRLQELHYGGLSAETRARIDALVAEEDARVAGKPRARVRTDLPVTGSRLIREWKGVEHQVTVLRDGFEYGGMKFKSLSAIARRIAGTRWNGPAFFGLRQAKARK